MRQFSKLLTLLIFLFTSGTLLAQNPANPLLYSYQAVQFGSQDGADDPISLIMPGTAFKSGLGSVADNPASLALHRKSFVDFGLNFRSVNENSNFLGQSRSLDNSANGVSNAGFLYAFPTVQGSMVMGATYTQHTVYDRAVGFRGRNNNSSITDKFKADGSAYQEIAFNTYATDFGDDVGDWDESIFRIGFDRFGDFLGIRQQGEIFESGINGEYSLFFATEFRENLMFGASLGILSGRFHYDRVFQEIDEFNDYDSTIIDTSDDGIGDTDIDSITLDDRLRSRFSGFRARAGLLYKINDRITIGGSYTLPSTIEVKETFDAGITTVFDNRAEFSDATDSEFIYKVTLPQRFSLGAGYSDPDGGLSLSASAEYTDYSGTRIRFSESDLFDSELIENDFIGDTYRGVLSYRVGAGYDISPDLTVRGGYSYLPGKLNENSVARTVLAGGVGFSVAKDIRLDLAVQYSFWEDVTAVYDYAQYDYSTLPDALPGLSFRSEEATRTASRLKTVASIRFVF
ncbi:MAG: hypothetical protein EA360_01785 [Balneolaceae bacterium]|nr:MAG: hypothetical protein EA360_01785 [Balneolaceae bacterium]